MKRRLLALGLLVSLVTLTACGSNNNQKTGSSGSKNSSQKASSKDSSSTDTSSNSAKEGSNSSSSESGKIASMNLGQIVKGDFSSIQGEWQNSKGKTVKISGNTVSGSGTEGKTFTLKTEQAQIEKNVALLNSTSQPPQPSETAAFSFIFAPAGVSPEGVTDVTDHTRDRIVWATNGGFDLFNVPESEGLFYYRVK